MKSELANLRAIRKKSLDLLLNIGPDLSAFLNGDNLTFRRRPEQKPDPNDVKVTTTCSCLMALALNGRFDIYGKDAELAKVSAKMAFEKVFAAKWESSDLSENNAFSTVLVLRAFGFLVTAGVLDSDFAAKEKKTFSDGDRTLTEIADRLFEKPNLSLFGINKYLPSAAVVYWFVDAISRSNIQLGDPRWVTLCEWAGKEFDRQISLVTARHEALMDPLAMAMAACLCSRLRSITGQKGFETMTSCLRPLPSSIELEHSVGALFEEQGKSGIWPKYFPLFHYPSAGSNFCFTFELLEAVLAEFGSASFTVIEKKTILIGLDKAVAWCYQNRLRYPVDNIVYHGWNSGGELESLNDGKPESWATAVVHMFLWELQHVLTAKIQQILLVQFDAAPRDRYTNEWKKLLDVPIKLKTGQDTTIKVILETHIITHASQFNPKAKEKMDGRVSALLFGPPGTSKTRLTRAVAGLLKWPIVELDPSAFLSNGIENIYSRAEEIFTDLNDLSGVVVLFDEMDALVQTRGAERGLDITSQFLTTSMLPKLAKLHDYGRLVFFFATNYQSKFDQAIKRPGRFDLLIFMGPPNWQDTLSSIQMFLPKKDKANADIAKVIQDKLGEITKKIDPKTRETLDVMTFTEKQNFFENLALEHGSVKSAVENLHPDTFCKMVGEFSKYITLRSGSVTQHSASDYEQWWEKERFESGLQ